MLLSIAIYYHRYNNHLRNIVTSSIIYIYPEIIRIIIQIIMILQIMIICNIILTNVLIKLKLRVSTNITIMNLYIDNIFILFIVVIFTIHDNTDNSNTSDSNEFSIDYIIARTLFIIVTYVDNNHSLCSSNICNTITILPYLHNYHNHHFRQIANAHQ